MAYRIRPARPDDEPFLAAMLELAANWREPEPGRQPNPVEPHYVRGFGRPGDIGLDHADRLVARSKLGVPVEGGTARVPKRRGRA